MLWVLSIDTHWVVAVMSLVVLEHLVVTTCMIGFLPLFLVANVHFLSRLCFLSLFRMKNYIIFETYDL